ncbi:MAG: choice-of-anchor D domain-containing protein [Verrucomicrobiota bacterium]
MNCTHCLPESSFSTFTRARAFLAGLWLLAGLGALVAPASAAVTLGDNPQNRSFNDSSSGQVYIYNGGTFGITGTAVTFKFYDNDFSSGYVTPLLFERTSTSPLRFVLRGVGTTVTSTAGGVHTVSFTLLAGSSSVGSSYTFGFTDRQLSYSGSGNDLTTDNSNTGVVDFDSSGNWYFTPTQTFEIKLGQTYEYLATTAGDSSLVRIDSDGRIYSAQVIAESPEINVTGNGVSIADGDTTPSTADHTDFGSVSTSNGTVTRTFTIRNTGSDGLTLSGSPKVALSGTGSSHFSVTTQPSSPLSNLSIANSGFETPAQSAGGYTYGPSGASWTFGNSAGIARNSSPWYVNAAPEGVQAAFIQDNEAGSYFSQDISFLTSGTYIITFWIVRRSSSYPANDVDVRMDGVSIGSVPNTSQTTDTWAMFTFDYTCTTPGTHTLSFVGMRDGDYDSAIDDVQIHSTTTFQVTYNPSAGGSHVATVSIANTDGDENPYNFDIQGASIADLNSNAVSWWKAENNANDAINNNHGTLNGDTTYATGKVGNAFSFDGSGDFISVPDASSLDLSGSFTIEGWIQIPDYAGHYPIVTKQPNDGGFSNYPGNYEFRVQQTTGLLLLGFSDSSQNNVFSLSTNALPTGTLIHVAGVYDSSAQKLRLYVNGVLDSDTSTSGMTPQVNSNPLLIGKRVDGLYFKGLIDELTIYNTALSQTEIQSIYGAGTLGKLLDLDFGDAPTAAQSGFASDYPTTLAQNGARHRNTGMWLGFVRDGETDGQPTANADGDDGAAGSANDDDDGVFVGAMNIGQSANAFVKVFNGPGKLDAWVDFNRDGDWDDANEQILNTYAVVSGDNTVSFSVPAGALPGKTYARFRLSTAGGLAATGAASDGEVEDYLVLVAPTISSLSATTGTPGTTSININGTGFDGTPANNTVFFGATRASITAASTTQLTVTVPDGATYGLVSVAVNGASAFSPTEFLPTFSGSGSPTFGSRVNFDTPGGPNGSINPLPDDPRAVAIGDLDGDGKPEVVLCNGAITNVSVYLNAVVTPGDAITTSSFSTRVDVPTGDFPRSVTLADIDKDGKLDLIVANGGTFSSNISVIKNTSTVGNLSFAAKVDLNGVQPNWVSVVDVDRDGRPDILAANVGSFSVYRNIGVPGVIDTGTFYFSRLDLALQGGTATVVTAGDFDGDGWHDLVALDYSKNQVSVFRNLLSSAGTLSNLGAFNADCFDTRQDFAVGVTVVSPPPPSDVPQGMVVADFNVDGKLDVAVTIDNPNTSPTSANYESVTLLRNTSSGAGNVNFASYVRVHIGGATSDSTVGDLDGDGKPDIAVHDDLTQLGQNLRVLDNVSSGATLGFATTVLPQVKFIRAVAAGDLNGDDKPDIAFGNFDDGKMSVIENTTSTTAAPEIHLTGNGVSIFAGDATPSTADDTDFGTALTTGGTVVHTFTVYNSGSANLAVSAINVSGANAGDFTVGSLTPASPVTAGGSATFTVTFDPSASGTRSATIEVVSDDSDEASYTFAVQGSGSDSQSFNANDGGGNGSANGTADTLRIRLNGANIEFSADNFTTISSVPFASVNSITISGSSDNDTFIIDLSSGNPIPAGGLTVTGSTGTDSLTITGGAQGTVTYNYTNANDGNIVMSNFGTVTYTGLEPISNSGTATDVIFNLPNSANADATLADDATPGDGVMQLTGSTFEDTTFTVPTSSLTITGGTDTDTITVTSVDSMYGASLTINGGTGNDTVNLNGDITFAGGNNLNVDLTDDAGGGDVDAINIGSNANHILSGAGVATLKCSKNIALASGSGVATADGNLTLSANSTGATTGTFRGIDVDGGMIQATGTGVVTLTGWGGNSGADQYGIHIRNGGDVIGGTAGTMVLTGTGGASTTGEAQGFRIEGSTSSVTSGGANVQVNGTGTGTSSCIAGGVLVRAGAFVSAGGTGTVTVTGTSSASSTVNFNIGVSVQDFSVQSPRITSNNGNVTVVGTGGGSGGASSVNHGVSTYDGGVIEAGGAASTVTVRGTGGNTTGGSPNHGISISSQTANASKITSSGGDVLVTGIAGTSSGTSVGIEVQDANASITTALNGGDVTLAADSMRLAGTVAADASSTVTLRPANSTDNPVSDNGDAIILGPGSDTTANTLELSDTELDLVNAGTVMIGDASSGAVTISNAITHPNNLTISVGSTITFNQSVTMAADKNLTVTTTTTTTGISLGSPNGDLSSSGTGAITITSARTIVLNGGSSVTTVDGALTLSANAAGTTAGNFVGVDLNNGVVQATGTGTVSVTGKGGGGATAMGVRVQAGGDIIGGTSGTLTVTGGGVASAAGNVGVLVTGSGSRITSIGSHVDVTGSGSGTIAATGARGVEVNSGEISATGSGNVSVTGIEGFGTSNEGIKVTGAGATIQCANTTLTLIAETMDFDTANAVVDAGAGGAIVVHQRLAGSAIDVGGADSFGPTATPLSTLGLTDAELDRFSADSVTVGDANSGAITISAAIDHGNSLSLVGGAAITFNNTLSLSAGKDLTVNAGTFININTTSISTGGAQTYSDPVNVTATTTLASTGSADITFSSTVNGNFGLVVNTSGITRFQGVVGGTTPLASLTTDSGGSTRIQTTAITAQGSTITFNDPVALTMDTDFSDTGATGIFFNNTVDSDGTPRNLTASISNGAAQVQFAGAVGAASALNAVTINNAGALTIGAAADFTVEGAFNQTGGGAVSLAGDITTTADNISFNAAVTITGNTALSTGAGAGNISFSSTVNDDGATSDRTLTLTAGTGTVTCTGNIGGTRALQTFTIVSATTATLNQVRTTTGGIIVTATGITLNANLSADVDTTTAGSVALNGAVTLGADPVTIDTDSGTTDGTITIGGLADDGSQRVLNLTAGTGAVSFSGAGTFNFEVDGNATPGTDFDRINVTGTLALNNATLNFPNSSIASSAAQQVRILNNDSTDTITGTFNGLADGDSVTINAITFYISYNGGDGNDIVLSQAPTAAVAVSGTSGNDTIQARKVGDTVQVLVNGNISASYPESALTGFGYTINGLAGNDTLTLNYVDDATTDGFFAIPITFNGGTQTTSDALVITDAPGTATTVTHTFSNATDGTVDIDGTVITYTGLEPLTDNLDAANRVFTFNGGAEVITVSSVSATQTRIDSILSEAVTFINPTTSLTINAGTGNDLVSIDSLSSGWGGAVGITINGDDGDDTISLNKTVAILAAFTVTGGNHATADTLNFDREGDAGITSSTGGPGPGTISGGTPAIQTVSFDATVETITINANPTGANESATILEDNTKTFASGDFTFSDSDGGDTFGSLLIMSVETAGDLEFNLVDVIAGDVIAAGSLNQLVFTPVANSNGTPYATFTFRVRDNNGNASAATYTYTINVTAVNDEPSFVKGADHNVSTTAGTVSSAGWATSINKGAANESSQTLTFVLVNDNNALFTTQPAVSSTGTLTYTIAGTTGSANVDIYLMDNGGTANSGDDTSPTQSFVITVANVSAASGDYVVADRGPYFSTGTILLYQGGTQQIITTTLKDPYDVDLDASGNAVIADYETDGSTPGIFEINLSTLAQTTKSSGGSLVVPFAVKVDKSGGANDGKYIVADLDADNNGANEWGAIFVVDPGAASPGNQTKISSRTTGTGTDFYWMTGLAVGSAGDIYVCDQGNQSSPATQPPRIFHVDPSTGNRTVMGVGGAGSVMLRPIGIVVESGTGTTATLVIVDAGQKKLIRFTGVIGSVTASETLSHTGVTFDLPTHVTIDGNGDYVITDAPVNAPAGQRRIHVMDSTTLSTTTVTTDGFLEQPRGITVVP